MIHLLKRLFIDKQRDTEVQVWQISGRKAVSWMLELKFPTSKIRSKLYTHTAVTR
jgi:hypothetical protein